jgi:hypothetical protein
MMLLASGDKMASDNMGSDGCGPDPAFTAATGLGDGSGTLQLVISEVVLFEVSSRRAIHLHTGRVHQQTAAFPATFHDEDLCGRLQRGSALRVQCNVAHVWTRPCTKYTSDTGCRQGSMI